MTKKRLKELEVKFPLTEQEKRLLFSIAQRVWDIIGYDVLQAVADESRRNINRVTIRRAEVIEVVLDADRLESDVRHATRKEPMPQVLALFPAKYDADAHDYRMELMKQTFTFASYGM